MQSTDSHHFFMFLLRFQAWILEHALHGGLPHSEKGFSSSLYIFTYLNSDSSSKFHDAPVFGLMVPMSIENPGRFPMVIA